ncbi:flagellin [Pseudothioclava nitratireducens]|jgi:flagellin|uniref:flagellin n=1 Tax=Pseudothioclava nitratireducens TaxID=1928646 RepID=UPI0023DB1CB9|nr:flagellin [Defluviimonas nitratireducens]MDF1620496.1 flagellin [Defluviimonas nitratireducens]
MSSILTNTSAMVALQTLKGINSGLASTQAQISTGKSIASAKDNAAVWAISKVMESDVKGFQGISDSLALGESTVAVARQASETVTNLLTEMKGKIVAAQESNVDKAKIQTDISALRDQIEAVVGAAQFNGLNLVDGSSAATVDVLSSLNRSADGTVTAEHIGVAAQNLSIGGYAAQTVFTGTDGVTTDTADAFSFSLDANGGTDDAGTVVVVDTNLSAGDKINMRIGDTSISYTVTAEDVASTTTADVVAVGIKSAIENSGANVTVDYNSGTAGTLSITNNGTDSISISGQYENAGSGGLGLLSSINVDDGAGGDSALALTNIETLIQTASNAAAAFGSAESRIQTQSDFISNLTDSMRAGIGSLVDADMEEASARLQALQTQQQLGIQALSIANQQPQNILSLFR